MKHGIMKKAKMMIFLGIACLGLEGCGSMREACSSIAVNPVRKVMNPPIEDASASAGDRVVISEPEEPELMNISKVKESVAEPEETVLDENMMIAEINGEEMVFYLEDAYYYGSGDFGPCYITYNSRGEALYGFIIEIDKDWEEPGTYISLEEAGAGCDTCFMLINLESSETDFYVAANYPIHKFGDFAYTITERDETGTHYQGIFSAVLVRDHYDSESDKDTEVPVSGEFDFTLGETHDVVAEMEEKSKSGQTGGTSSKSNQTAAPSSAGSSGSYQSQLCSYCGGTGACSYCSGLGDCEHCLGMGYNYCSSCSGSGNCQKCYGQGGEMKYTFGGDNKWVRCSRCGGTGNYTRCSGNREEDCNYCNGSGDCGRCYGSGECQYCGGTGQ